MGLALRKTLGTDPGALTYTVRLDQALGLMVEAGPTWILRGSGTSFTLQGGLGWATAPWAGQVIPLEASFLVRQPVDFLGARWEATVGIRDALVGAWGGPLMNVIEVPVGLGVRLDGFQARPTGDPAWAVTTEAGVQYLVSLADRPAGDLGMVIGFDRWHQEWLPALGLVVTHRGPGPGTVPTLAVRFDATVGILVDGGVTVPLGPGGLGAVFLGGGGLGVNPWLGTSFPVEASAGLRQEWSLGPVAGEVSLSLRELVNTSIHGLCLNQLSLPLAVGFRF